MIGTAATGAVCESRVLAENEDEVKKMLMAELLRARQIILLDNADHRKKLYSSSLLSVLTATKYADRLLGVSEMASAPNQALWLMTGNNPRLDMELARRCIRIRIVPVEDRPWKRTQFRHPKLLKWVTANRGALVHAILTVVLGWIAAGRPTSQKQLGSFEEWAELVGGILEFAGIEGFLANLDDLYDQADQDGQNWSAFVTAWWEEYREAETQVSELQDLCDRLELLQGVRWDGNSRSQQVRLGTALSNQRDRRFANLKIEKVQPESKHRGVSYYRLAYLITSNLEVSAGAGGWSGPDKLDPHGGARGGQTLNYSDCLGQHREYGSESDVTCLHGRSRTGVEAVIYTRHAAPPPAPPSHSDVRLPARHFA